MSSTNFSLVAQTKLFDPGPRPLWLLHFFSSKVYISTNSITKTSIAPTKKTISKMQ